MWVRVSDERSVDGRMLPGACGSQCCFDQKRKTKMQVLGKADFAERFFFRFSFFFQKHSTCIVTMLLAAMAAFCREMEILQPNSVPHEVPLFLEYTNLFFLFYLSQLV